MNKSKKRILAVLVAIILIMAIILPKLNLFQTKADSQSGSGLAPGATPVQTYLVQPQALNDRVITSGTVLANEQVELKSEVSGKITSIDFDEGTRVSHGQLLVKINDSELQAQLRKVIQQLELAEKREFRQSQLLDRQAVSQEVYDQTLIELNNLKAEVDLLEARIDKTEIRAPFDGIIGLRYVSIGDYISPSSRIAALLDLDPVKIDFSIPERYVGAVSSDDEIQFTAESLADSYTGKVYAIEPDVDLETRTLQLRAIASNTDSDILPGTFVEVELILDEIPDALMIPTEALIPEIQGQKVFLVKNGKAASASVKTGIRTEDKIQITEGIQPMDTVVTSGILSIRPGAEVQITEIVE